MTTAPNKRLERTRHERALFVVAWASRSSTAFGASKFHEPIETNTGYPREVILRTENDLRRLLIALCIEWGFCLPPEASDEIARRLTITADEFAGAVLEAEEMNPEYEQDWFRRIRDRFIEEFQE